MSNDTNYSVLFNQLIEVDGPFLTVPVARNALGKILERADQRVVNDLRVADEERRGDASLNSAWIRWVLQQTLEFDDEVLREGPAIAHLNHLVGQHGVTLRPTMVAAQPDAASVQPALVISEWPADQSLTAKAATDQWNASPIARMVELCRGLKVPLGLVTNGRSWTLVYAPAAGATSTATWDAELWHEERETLDLFIALLGAARFFGVEDAETLPRLLEDSANSKEEVTLTLGRQVRRSVELLVSALSDANRERHGELLEDTKPGDVYRGAVTVMMRLVFLLSAEERDLLFLGDDLYDANYAVSTLLDQLEEDPDVDELFRRFDAWPRLLATFRLIYGGANHDRLTLPAYGGRLFDPDRFPFLEGRIHGEPFDFGGVDDRLLRAINNRVVLEVLRSLQRLHLGKFGEVRRLSFRHLDVEQIGTVYEGLLDHSCAIASATTLCLMAKRSSKGNIEPEIELSELEAKLAEGRPGLEAWLSKEHKFTKSELKKLDLEPSDLQRTRLSSACGNDLDLAARVEPFFGLIRTDLRGLPQVFLEDSYVVTESQERSDTGAHYTPKVIAEETVEHTLAPLVYEPGPHNEDDPSNWALRPWSEIADLTVVDPACGSGAMLVAACRYLADRLVEAWDEQNVSSRVGLPLPGAQGTPLELPTERNEWTTTAMRLVADRCLYGVDINEMAVEMCKVSLWLATLSKNKPFSFLDHSIRHGDALLGITTLDDLKFDGFGGVESVLSYATRSLQPMIAAALDKRLDLLAMPATDAHDVQEKERLFASAQMDLEAIRTVADAITGLLLSTSGKSSDDQKDRYQELVKTVKSALEGGDGSVFDLDDLQDKAMYLLDHGRPALAPPRTPLHWPIAFPEVFLDRREKFDATISNPPFLGGQKISGVMGDTYRTYLVGQIANGARGSADMVAYFFLRAGSIATYSGYIATNTIGQGETSKVGLAQLIDRGSTVFRAISSAVWPGDASVEVAQVWNTSGNWNTLARLDGARVDVIDEMLYRRSPSGWRKQKLTANKDQAFQGSILVGTGFAMAAGCAEKLVERDERNAEVLFPYLGGEDLNQSPTLTAPRWVINFHDWPEAKAREYPDCFDIVERDVKPFRQERNHNGEFKRRSPMPQKYWLYGENRPKLRKTIGGLDRVLAICLHSKSVMPVFVPAAQVFSHACGVFAYDDDFRFGVLSSGFHFRWAGRYGSTMRNDLRYTASDVFETFPQPDWSQAVEAVGEALDKHRSERMVAADEGITDTYNRVHDPDDGTPEIVRLRELHTELDLAVRSAYGWDDLELEHGFHPVRGQGIRYTFSPDASVEVLYRLLELNKERYEAEVAEGLHGKRSNQSGSGQSEIIFK